MRCNMGQAVLRGIGRPDNNGFIIFRRRNTKHHILTPQRQGSRPARTASPSHSTSIFGKQLKGVCWICLKVCTHQPQSTDISTAWSLFLRNQIDLSVRDYRPISLEHGIIKIISKALSVRLSKVMESLISPFQSAFIKGCLIFESFTAASKIINTVSKSKLATWCSPLLFILIADTLNCMLQLSTSKKIMEPMGPHHKISSTLHSSPYADDTIIFYKATSQQLKLILYFFELLTGLKINFKKSFIVGLGNKWTSSQSLRSNTWLQCFLISYRLLGNTIALQVNTSYKLELCGK